MKKINFRNCIQGKGKTTGRKGMGMELALLVLFVVFGCSILLVSAALLGKSNLNDRKQDTIEHLKVNEFAEKVIAAKVHGLSERYFDRNDYPQYVDVEPSDGSGAWDELTTHQYELVKDAKLVIVDKYIQKILLIVEWDSGNNITRWEHCDIPIGA